MGPNYDKAAMLAAASIACGAVDGAIVGLLSRNKALGCAFGILSTLGMGTALCIMSQAADECEFPDYEELD